MIRSGLLVASILCGLSLAPAHAEQPLRLAQAAPAQPASPTPAAQPPGPATQPAADASQPAADEPAGNVAILKGTATVTRNGMTGPLKLQDDIFKGDRLLRKLCRGRRLRWGEVVQLEQSRDVAGPPLALLGHHPQRRWKTPALRTIAARWCTGGSCTGWCWWCASAPPTQNSAPPSDRTVAATSVSSPP